MPINTETHWACSGFMFGFERAKGLMLGRPMLNPMNQELVGFSKDLSLGRV